MNNGFILLARSLLDSKIWDKNSNYLKIWIYILLRVNYKNRLYPRGTNFFNYQLEKDKLPEVSQDVWLRCIKWLKNERKVATQKTTRGLIITVLKYEEFQDLGKYLKDVERDTGCDTGATQVRHRRDTIKERKKRKEDKFVANATVDLGKFPLEQYKLVTEAYKRIKNVTPQGREWLPIQREIKLMFQSGRTPQQVIEAMEVCNNLYEDWAMSTIRMKIADVVSGKLGRKGVSEKIVIKTITQL